MTTPDATPLPDDAETVDLAMVEADLDDESPEVIGAFLELALRNGALDAVAVPIIMKKGRPGVRIQVLSTDGEAASFAAMMLRETSTLGVRTIPVRRTALARRTESILFEGHEVRVKVALWNGSAIKAKPEFEDVRRAAEAAGVPLRTAMERLRAQLAGRHGF